MTYFVRIDEPVKLRRSILEAAKESILYQYQYREFLDIREEKQGLLQQIDEDYQSLEDSVDTLLDQIDIDEIHGDIDDIVEDKTDDGGEETDVDRDALTETDRLKYTLDRIENTLEEL